MNTDSIKILIQESINLERNVAELYSLFANYFQGDKDFWWQLAVEENNHADLLKGIELGLFDSDSFVKDLLSQSLIMLKKDNLMISNLISEFSKTVPSLETACQVSLELENSAAEFHFQKFMEKETDDIIVSSFQHLNSEDIDHAERIEAFMKKKGFVKD